MSSIKIERIRVDLIVAEDRLRRVDPLKVSGFVNDIGKRGLKTPLTVSKLLMTGCHRLVTGGHRFEAIRQPGWEEVDVVIHHGTLDEQDMDEALENLTRSELTQLDRSLHVAQVKRIWLKHNPDRKHGGFRKEGECQESTVETWAEAIVGQTGWSGGTLARAAKIGKEIDPKAADYLFGTDVSNSLKELLALIKYGPELQRAIAEKISAGEAKTVAQGAALVAGEPEPERLIITPEKQVKKVYSAFEKMTPDAKMMFAKLLKSEGFL